MNKRTIGVAAIALLLLIVGTVWALRSRADAQLDKVRELGKEAFGAGGRPDPQKAEEFRNAMRDLSDGQRRATRRGNDARA